MIAVLPALQLGQRLGRLLLLALALPLGGCAGMYFRDAGPAPVIRHELARLPYSEYWTGIVFNGEKIGFAHFDIRSAGAGNYEIRSEASFDARRSDSRAATSAWVMCSNKPATPPMLTMSPS